MKRVKLLYGKLWVFLFLAFSLIPTSSQGTDLWEELKTGKVQLIDLTHPLNEKNPFWPGPKYFPFKLETIATLEKDGVFSMSFCVPEHYGTHLDAPNHFEKGLISVDQISTKDLIGPAIVINVEKHVAKDPDYRLSIDDIKDWENRYGPIPQDGIVFMYTGWDKRWSDVKKYRNMDAKGVMHFPGFSKEAVEFLVKKRDIKAIGIDTLSVDYGSSKDFVVHHISSGAGRYNLENVANLDKLPPKGATLIVAPIKIEGGTGGPTRIFALLPK